MDFWLLIFFPAIIKKETFPIISLQKLFVPCNRMQMQFIFIFFSMNAKKNTSIYIKCVFIHAITEVNYVSFSKRYKNEILFNDTFKFALNWTFHAMQTMYICIVCCVLAKRHIFKKKCINTKLLDIHMSISKRYGMFTVVNEWFSAFHRVYYFGV